MTHKSASLTLSKPALASLLLVAVLSTGCTRQQGLLPNYLEDDLRERHVIKQQPMQQRLSVVPIGPGHDRISPNDMDRIKSFVGTYQLSALSSLDITYSGSQAAQPLIANLLKSLDESRVTTRAAGSKSGFNEIVFSYTATQTVLDRNCAGSHSEGGGTLMVPNKTMGCALTTAFAQQIDQPRDLIEPRPLDKKFYTSKQTSNDAASINTRRTGFLNDQIISPLR